MPNFDTTFLLALAGAVLAAASIVLHVVAPRTKATWDDTLRDDVDQLRALVFGARDAAAVPVPKAPPIAPVAMLALLLLGLGAIAMQPACTAAQRTSAKATAWKCTDPVRAEAVSALTPLAVTGIQAAASFDAKLIDYSKVEAMFARANLLTDAGLLVACVAADAFVALSQPAAALPGAAAAAPLELDPGALRKTFDRLRAEKFPGATFVTSHGEI